MIFILVMMGLMMANGCGGKSGNSAATGGNNSGGNEVVEPVDPNLERDALYLISEEDKSLKLSSESKFKKLNLHIANDIKKIEVSGDDYYFDGYIDGSDIFHLSKNGNYTIKIKDLSGKEMALYENIKIQNEDGLKENIICLDEKRNSIYPSERYLKMEHGDKLSFSSSTFKSLVFIVENLSLGDEENFVSSFKKEMEYKCRFGKRRISILSEEQDGLFSRLGEYRGESSMKLIHSLIVDVPYSYSLEGALFVGRYQQLENYRLEHEKCKIKILEGEYELRNANDTTIGKGIGPATYHLVAGEFSLINKGLAHKIKISERIEVRVDNNLLMNGDRVSCKEVTIPTSSDLNLYQLFENTLTRRDSVKENGMYKLIGMGYEAEFDLDVNEEREVLVLEGGKSLISGSILVTEINLSPKGENCIAKIVKGKFGFNEYTLSSLPSTPASTRSVQKGYIYFFPKIDILSSKKINWWDIAGTKLGDSINSPLVISDEVLDFSGLFKALPSRYRILKINSRNKVVEEVENSPSIDRSISLSRCGSGLHRIDVEIMYKHSDNSLKSKVNSYYFHLIRKRAKLMNGEGELIPNIMNVTNGVSPFSKGGDGSEIIRTNEIIAYNTDLFTPNADTPLNKGLYEAGVLFRKGSNKILNGRNGLDFYHITMEEKAEEVSGESLKFDHSFDVMQLPKSYFERPDFLPSSMRVGYRTTLYSKNIYKDSEDFYIRTHKGHRISYSVKSLQDDGSMGSSFISEDLRTLEVGKYLLSIIKEGAGDNQEEVVKDLEIQVLEGDLPLDYEGTCQPDFFPKWLEMGYLQFIFDNNIYTHLKSEGDDDNNHNHSFFGDDHCFAFEYKGKGQSITLKLKVGEDIVKELEFYAQTDREVRVINFFKGLEYREYGYTLQITTENLEYAIPLNVYNTFPKLNIEFFQYSHQKEESKEYTKTFNLGAEISSNYGLKIKNYLCYDAISRHLNIPTSEIKFFLLGAWDSKIQDLNEIFDFSARKREETKMDSKMFPLITSQNLERHLEFNLRDIKQDGLLYEGLDRSIRIFRLNEVDMAGAFLLFGTDIHHSQKTWLIDYNIKSYKIKERMSKYQFVDSVSGWLEYDEKLSKERFEIIPYFHQIILYNHDPFGKIEITSGINFFQIRGLQQNLFNYYFEIENEDGKNDISMDVEKDSELILNNLERGSYSINITATDIMLGKRYFKTEEIELGGNNG